MNLAALNESLLKATKASGKLDVEIACVAYKYDRIEIEDDSAGPRYYGFRGDQSTELAPRMMRPFTASIDAAASLEVPGLEEVCIRRYTTGVYVRWTHLAAGFPRYTAHYGNAPDSLAPTEPLGRCMARVAYEIALQTRQMKESST